MRSYISSHKGTYMFQNSPRECFTIACFILTWKQKKLPCRAFAIGTKVLNLNELNADGVPTNNLRYVRDSQYSEPQKKWLYQLNGRDYKNSAGWVPEDALRRYPLDEENLSIAQVAVLGMGRELR